MTADEFDGSNWLNGMTCVYRGDIREIVSCDAVERLIGLMGMDDEEAIDMVRCEKVSDVTYPAAE